MGIWGRRRLSKKSKNTTRKISVVGSGTGRGHSSGQGHRCSCGGQSSNYKEELIASSYTPEKGDS